MSKNQEDKKKPSMYSKSYKKDNKIMAIKNDFVVVLASNFRGINWHATSVTTGGDVFISSVMCCATYKEGPGV